MAPLLEMRNLRVELTTKDGSAPVIDDLSFALNAAISIAASLRYLNEVCGVLHGDVKRKFFDILSTRQFHHPHNLDNYHWNPSAQLCLARI